MSYVNISDDVGEIKKVSFVKNNNDYEYSDDPKKYSLNLINVIQDSDQWISDTTAITEFELKDDNKSIRITWEETDKLKFNAYIGVNNIKIRMEDESSQDNKKYNSKIIASGSIIGVKDTSDNLVLD